MKLNSRRRIGSARAAKERASSFGVGLVERVGAHWGATGDGIEGGGRGAGHAETISRDIEEIH